MKRLLSRLLHWELWHFNAIYAPLGFVWMYFVVKAKAFWFFSNVNPTLQFGGFEGESKREMYEQLPAHLYPATVYISPGENVQAALQKIYSAGIAFPFIAKPDIGTQGLLFRKLNTEADFIKYHSFLTADYLVQTFVDLPQEYSLFYIRYPGETKGKITGTDFERLSSGNGRWSFYIS